LIDLTFGLFLCDAVTLFDDADEFRATAAGARKIVIGEFTPLALHFALHLFPIAFQLFPIHRIVLQINARNGVNRPTDGLGLCSRPNTLSIDFTQSCFKTRGIFTDAYCRSRDLTGTDIAKMAPGSCRRTAMIETLRNAMVYAF
jgi:hypothetical protein